MGLQKALEGGRTSRYGRAFGREERRRERHQAKAWVRGCRVVSMTSKLEDETFIKTTILEGKVDPRRMPARRDVSFRGNVVRRWMRAQVGKAWGVVYAAFCQAFPADTYVGAWYRRYHGRDALDGTKFLQSYPVSGFYMDEEGILRFHEKPKSTSLLPTAYGRAGEERGALLDAAWARCGTRVPGRVGERFFWFDRASGRQMKELTKSEQIWLLGLYEEIRETLLDAAPVSMATRFERAHRHPTGSAYVYRDHHGLKMACHVCRLEERG